MTDRLKEAYTNGPSGPAVEGQRGIERPSGHTIACGGSWFSRSSDQRSQGRHPQEFEPERAVFLPFCQWLVLLRTQIRRGGLLDARFSPLEDRLLCKRVLAKRCCSKQGDMHARRQ